MVNLKKCPLSTLFPSTLFIQHFPCFDYYIPFKNKIINNNPYQFITVTPF